MFTKICPFCGARSYSASTFGKWTCPTCNADLSRIDAYNGVVNEGDDLSKFPIYPTQYKDPEEDADDES